jgi:hypothetical protein
VSRKQSLLARQGRPRYLNARTCAGPILLAVALVIGAVPSLVAW